jgi:hypothetical protein
MKITIYPNKEELRGAVEKYLKSNHYEYFYQFSETQWTGMYNKNIHKKVGAFSSILKFLISKMLIFSLKVIEERTIVKGSSRIKNQRYNIYGIRGKKPTAN